MNAPAHPDCQCGRPHSEHFGHDLAPQCIHLGSTCLRYRPTSGTPAKAPVARPSAAVGATRPVPPPVPPSPAQQPQPGPTAEQLIAGGKRSALKRVNNLASKIEHDLADLAERLHAEREEAEAKQRRDLERERALKEIKDLETKLAAAKERLKSRRHELGLSGGERASEGGHQCPDCPETFPLRLTTGQWGMVARLKTTGGTWSTYLSQVKNAGLVQQDAGGWFLTDAGFDYLGGRPAPMTAAELQEHYRTILKTGAAKMLDAVIAAYPGALTKDELGEQAGIVTTGGTFSTYLSHLIRNGLAEKVGDEIRATEILMHGASA